MADPETSQAFPTVAEVVAAVALLYPPDLAEDWDAVGLVAGVPDRPVRRILVAVDPAPEVIAEAVQVDADLLLVHHPLLLTPVHSVAATSTAGRSLTALIEARCALLTAHTNADSADPGVSDALATALGLTDLKPLEPTQSDRLVLVTYVPPDAVESLVDALAAAGAGVVGEYERCAFTGAGFGTFEAPTGATPHVGRAGERSRVAEVRLEMVLPRSSADDVRAALRGAHPYEEPAFELLPVAAEDCATGIGRVGTLAAPLSLAAFADRVAATLPATAHGVRVAGDGSVIVRTVAVCGGAGDSLLSRTTGADVYLTADLRHHRVLDHRSDGGCAVVDVAHWASEWPWCAQVAAGLPGALGAGGAAGADNVEILVSSTPTDPWTSHVRSSP